MSNSSTNTTAFIIDVLFIYQLLINKYGYPRELKLSRITLHLLQIYFSNHLTQEMSQRLLLYLNQRLKSSAKIITLSIKLLKIANYHANCNTDNHPLTQAFPSSPAHLL